MTCFNRNTAQWKAINAKYKNPMVVDSIMTKWQQTNSTDVLPTLQEVDVYLKQKKQILATDQVEYKNTLLNNISERGLIKRFGDMYIIDSKNKNAIPQIYRLMKIWNVPSQAYSVKLIDDNFVLDIDRSKFNKSNMIVSRNNDTHVLDIIDHMLKMFPQLSLNVVSRDEAKAYYDNLSEEQKQLSYGASFFNVKAYYVDNTVKIVKGSVSPETIAEEILHPFVNTMEIENNSLYKGLLSEAKKIYPELLEQTQDIYKDYTQENLEREFLTKALSNNFNKEFEQQPTNTWRQRILDFLKLVSDAVKNLYKYISGKALTVKDIKSTSTISDIAKLLNTKDLKFNLNSDLIKNTAVQFELTDDRKGLVNQINEEATDEQKDIVDRLTHASRETKRRVENFTVSDYLKELADPIIINVDGEYYNIDKTNEKYPSVNDKLGAIADAGIKARDFRIDDINVILESVILKRGVEGVEQFKLKTITKTDVEKLYNALAARVEGLQETGAVLLPSVVIADPKTNVASTISILSIEENGTLTPINITYNRPQDSTTLLSLEKNSSLAKLFPNGITRIMLNAIRNNVQSRILENLGYIVNEKSKTININYNDSKIVNIDMPAPYNIADYVNYANLIVPEIIEKKPVDNVSEQLDDLAKQQDEMDINPFEAVGKKLTDIDLQEGLATNKLRRKTLEGYRTELLNKQKQIRAFNSQKALNDDGSAVAKKLVYIDKHLSLVANGLDSGAFDITYEKMLKDTSDELTRIKKYLNDPDKIVDYNTYLNAVQMFTEFIESYRSLADASEDLKELDIDPANIRFSDSERKLQDQVRRQLDDMAGRGTNKNSLLLNARKTAIKLYIMNNSESPFYNRDSSKFDENALNDLLNFIKDQSMIDQWSGTIGTAESPLLALADKLFKSTKINAINQVEARIDKEVRPLLVKLERLQPARNIIGQKRFAKDFFHYMYEFDSKKNFTGMTVQKTDYKNYQAAWDRETKDTKDELGEPLEYIIKDPSVLTEEDRNFNIKLHKARIRQAKFYSPESIKKLANTYTYEDGDYHKHTDAYKKARAAVSYFDTSSGQWVKKSDVSRYKYQKWRNKWKEKPDKDYQKMEYDFLNGAPTGVVEILPPKEYDRKFVDGKLTRIPRDKSSNGDNLVNPKYKAIMEINENDQLAVAKREFYLLYEELMEEYLNMLPASVKQSFNGKSPLIFNKFINNLSNEGTYFTRLYEKFGGFKPSRIKKGRLNPLKPRMSANTPFNKIAGVHVESPPIMYVGSAKDDNAIEALYELKQKLLTESTTVDPTTGEKKMSSKEYKDRIEEIDQKIMLLEDQPTKNEMSLDAGGNLIDFMSMANHYDNMNQIKGFLNAVQDILDSAMYQPGGIITTESYTDAMSGVLGYSGNLYNDLTPGSVASEKFATIPAVDAKLPKRYRTWLQNTFYRNVGKGRAEANVPKVMDKFKFFTSFLYVGTNWFANIANFIQGTNATWREAVGGNWVTMGSVTRATKEYYATALPSVFAKLGSKSSYTWLTGAGKYNKMKAPNEYWARTDFWRMMDSAAEVAEIGKQRAQAVGVLESAANMAFLLNNAVEYKVQTILGTAYLDTQKMQVRDKDGNVLEEKSLKDIGVFDSRTGEYKLDIAGEGGRFTHFMDTRNRTLFLTETGDQRIARPVKTKQQVEQFFGRIRNDIRELNIQAHGNYAYDDKTYIQSNFLGELAMQFGKWVAPLGRAAYTPLYYDENLGWVEGRQRALGNVVAQMFRLTRKAAFDANNPEISLLRRRNAIKMLYDYAVMAVSMAMSQYILGGDNEYDKGTFMRRFRYFARYSFEKLGKEVAFFTPLGIEQPIVMKSTDPFPLVRVIEESLDVFTTLHHIPYIYFADEELYKDLKRNKKYFYQRGRRRGSPKILKEMGDIWPFVYTLERWRGFDDKQEHYKKY